MTIRLKGTNTKRKARLSKRMIALEKSTRKERKEKIRKMLMKRMKKSRTSGIRLEKKLFFAMQICDALVRVSIIFPDNIAFLFFFTVELKKQKPFSRNICDHVLLFIVTWPRETYWSQVTEASKFVFTFFIHFLNHESTFLLLQLADFGHSFQLSGETDHDSSQVSSFHVKRKKS